MVQKELSGRALVWILSAAEEDYYLPLPRLSMTPVSAEFPRISCPDQRQKPNKY